MVKLSANVRVRRRTAPSASRFSSSSSALYGQVTRRAATSCGFQGDQLVFNIVHLHQAGTRRRIFKMQGDCLQDVGTKNFPRVCLGEDRMAQRTRAETALFRIANLEDQFHDIRIP